MHSYYLAATNVVYPAANQFGNLVLPNVQVAMSGEYEVTVRLPGLDTEGQPLNASGPRSVNVDVQSQWGRKTCSIATLELVTWMYICVSWVIYYVCTLGISIVRAICGKTTGIYICTYLYMLDSSTDLNQIQ